MEATITQYAEQVARMAVAPAPRPVRPWGVIGLHLTVALADVATWTYAILNGAI